ncbi:MAG TPA: serine/threonine protein kinase, partial [Actinoallomurus sp.]|nr:serine/threonine protein kinase [Actinoallomurus sp.]
TSPVAKPTAQELAPATALAYNRGPHADGAAPSDLGKATDSNKSSYWTTQHYTSANFGGLRSGVGLVLDMGKTVTVSKVKVLMPSGTPGTVELHIGDSPTSSTPKIDSGDATGSFELAGKQAKGRYVTLYFTKLPDIGEFKAKVLDAAVYGTD